LWSSECEGEGILDGEGHFKDDNLPTFACSTAILLGYLFSFTIFLLHTHRGFEVKFLKSSFTSNDHLPEEKEGRQEPGVAHIDADVPELPTVRLMVQLEVGKVGILSVLGVLEDQGQIIVDIPDVKDKICIRFLILIAVETIPMTSTMIWTTIVAQPVEQVTFATDSIDDGLSYLINNGLVFLVLDRHLDVVVVQVDEPELPHGEVMAVD